MNLNENANDLGCEQKNFLTFEANRTKIYLKFVKIGSEDILELYNEWTCLNEWIIDGFFDGTSSIWEFWRTH